MIAKQNGFNLIELMVALLLGLLITLAALQLFNTNQQTFALQQALSELHEDGQIAIRYMTDDFRQAGRGAAVAGSIPPVVIVEGAGSDEVTINFVGFRDCQGSGDDSIEQLIVNRYFYSDGGLRCEGSMTVGGSAELLSNVESFQIQYGVDGDAGSGLGVTQYVEAGNVGSNPVVSLRFALLLKSNLARFPTNSGANKFYLLDEVITVPADGHLRRIFMKTVHLRNYDWDGV